MFDKFLKSYKSIEGKEDVTGLFTFEDPSGLILRVRPTTTPLLAIPSDEFGYDENGKFGITKSSVPFTHHQPSYEISIDLNGQDPEAIIKKLKAVPDSKFGSLPKEYILFNKHIIPLANVERHIILAPALFDQIYASGLFEVSTIQKVADVVFGKTKAKEPSATVANKENQEEPSPPGSNTANEPDVSDIDASSDAVEDNISVASDENAPLQAASSPKLAVTGKKENTRPKMKQRGGPKKGK